MTPTDATHQQTITGMLLWAERGVWTLRLELFETHADLQLRYFNGSDTLPRETGLKAHAETMLEAARMVLEPTIWQEMSDEADEEERTAYQIAATGPALGDCLASLLGVVEYVTHGSPQ